MVILIVDDSRIIRRIEREVLSGMSGVRTVEAEDGLAAVHQLQALDFQVDLILVDWMMPRMDGLTFVRHMKSHENLSCFIPSSYIHLAIPNLVMLRRTQIFLVVESNRKCQIFGIISNNINRPCCYISPGNGALEIYQWLSQFHRFPQSNIFVMIWISASIHIEEKSVIRQ